MTSAFSSSVSDLVQQTLLGEAADELGVGLIAYSEDGSYLAANRLACELTGYERQELLALPVGSLTGESAHELAEQTARAGQGSGRGWIRRADGTSIEVDWLAAPTRIASLPAMASLFWPVGSFS
jgi:PAS domain S-box-containing protein